MAQTALTIAADRYLSKTLIGASLTAVAGDLAEQFTLPVGFGDCLIESVSVRVSNIDVILADVTLYGPTIYVRHAASGVVQDIVGSERWHREGNGANALAVSADVEVFRQVMWRSTEEMIVFTVNPDSDATPTGVFAVRIRVTRLRST